MVSQFTDLEPHVRGGGPAAVISVDNQRLMGLLVCNSIVLGRDKICCLGWGGSKSGDWGGYPST